MISAGTAFLLAYLPAHRIAHFGQRGTIEGAAGRLPAVRQLLDAQRSVFDARAQGLLHVDARIRALAELGGVTLPAIADATALAALNVWTKSLPDLVKPHLTTPLLEASWKAGMSARAVAVNAMMALYVGYLRCAAPNDFDLKSRASDLVKTLTSAAIGLQRDIEATGVPVVTDYGAEVRLLFASLSDREPSTASGYERFAFFADRVLRFLECHAHQLDEPIREHELGTYVPQILASIARWEALPKR